MNKLPVSEKDVEIFWNLDPKNQRKALETLARLDFKDWRHPRPVLCVGLGEPLFNYFLEKLMWRCPSVIGIFDPFYTGDEKTPYHSFPAHHLSTHERQYFKIFRALSELKMLKKAFPDLVVVDFSFTGPRTFLRRYLENENFDVVDFTFYELVENLVSVYEPWQEYRAKTSHNFGRFMDLEEKLDDTLSKKTLFAHLAFVFSADRTFLRSTALPIETVYKAFRPQGFMAGDIVVDAGAANGDSVLDFLDHSKNGFPEFICFEPDSVNFRKLKILQQRLQTVKIKLNKNAIGANEGEMDFSAQGTASSHRLNAGQTSVNATRVGMVCLDATVEKCSFLKMDIEGAEADALRGAQKLFAANRPEAAICVYHFALDLLECADIIENMGLNYKLNLRRHLPYIYELVLYANPL